MFTFGAVRDSARAPTFLLPPAKQGRRDARRIALNVIRVSCDEREKQIENFLSIVYNFRHESTVEC